MLSRVRMDSAKKQDPNNVASLASSDDETIPSLMTHIRSRSLSCPPTTCSKSKTPAPIDTDIEELPIAPGKGKKRIRTYVTITDDNDDDYLEQPVKKVARAPPPPKKSILKRSHMHTAKTTAADKAIVDEVGDDGILGDISGAVASAPKKRAPTNTDKTIDVVHFFSGVYTKDGFITGTARGAGTFDVFLSASLARYLYVTIPQEQASQGSLDDPSAAL